MIVCLQPIKCSFPVNSTFLRLSLSNEEAKMFLNNDKKFTKAVDISRHVSKIGFVIYIMMNFLLTTYFQLQLHP